MRLISRLLAAGAVAAAAVLAHATGVTGGGTDAPAVAPVADAAPGYAVEDFNYPQADKILAEQGFLLKRGDGHIVLATCGSEPDLLEVWARSKEKVCFRFTGNKGYLSLELPSVYGIKGNDYNTDVTMTVENEEKSFKVDKNSWTPVGESADPEGREHMLVEIIASK
ncbi:hypothetical protein [Streptomyces sp. WMMC940]|uniref:hypothetical protein n=1 Tax=Streptomyces sp. WMMC940 TaxID=3015153 RepID=UPI0022B6C605|nr:hypothetical protein [Streptomyces sp. WMMC940]MCZ7456217.1 hypothetical protein [Streptomyces sp. WMMC940]